MINMPKGMEMELYENEGILSRLGRNKIIKPLVLSGMTLLLLPVSKPARAEETKTVTIVQPYSYRNPVADFFNVGEEIKREITMDITGPKEIKKGKEQSFTIMLESDPTAYNWGAFVVGSRDDAVDISKNVELYRRFGGNWENKNTINIHPLELAASSEKDYGLFALLKGLEIGMDIKLKKELSKTLPAWAKSQDYETTDIMVTEYASDRMPNGAKLIVPVTCYKDDTLNVYAVIDLLTKGPVVLEGRYPVDVRESLDVSEDYASKVKVTGIRRIDKEDIRFKLHRYVNDERVWVPIHVDENSLSQDEKYCYYWYLNSGVFLELYFEDIDPRIHNDPKLSPDGTKRLFSNGDQIRIVDSDGKNEKVLIETSSIPGWSQYWWGGEDPCWSPDGEKIVFANWVSLYDTVLYNGDFQIDKNRLGQSDLWIANSDGSGVRNLTGKYNFDNIRDPVFLPSGNEIIFKEEHEKFYERFSSTGNYSVDRWYVIKLGTK